MGGASRFVTLLSTTPFRPPLLLRLPHRFLSSPPPLKSFSTPRPLKSTTITSSSSSSPSPTSPSSSASASSISQSHPWPEWSLLISFLGPHATQHHQILPENAFMMYEEKELPLEFIRYASVLLAFARNNPHFLGMLSRKDIEVVVINGTPFLFKGALETARRMRTFLALGADNATTVDLMKYILSYASNPAIPSSKTSIYSRELVESSVRNLLQELTVLNSGNPLVQPVQEQTQFQNSDGQMAMPSNQSIVMKRGDWICAKCSFLNFARNSQCLECEEYRPKKLLTGSEWECPQCDFRNYGRNAVCLRCDCKKAAPLLTNSVNSTSSGSNESYANHSSTNHMPSQDHNASDMSITANEDFPEIMPLRRGENRFVVSTRKTPLERRQTSTSKDIASVPDSADKSNVDALVQRSLDKILGRTSAISQPENGEAAALIQRSGVSEASSLYDAGEVKKFQRSENPENLDNVKSINKEQEDESGRFLKRMDELHNIKDLSSAVPDGDLPDIMPARKGENRFVVSKRKDRSVTSPTDKRNMAKEQTSSSKYVPFVPFPPGYFARTEPQSPKLSVSPVNSADNLITSPQVTQRSSGMDNSRVIKDDAGSIKRTENDQISSASKIFSVHQEISSNSYASRTTYTDNSAQNLSKTDLLKDASPNYARASHGEDSKRQDVTLPTNATVDSLHRPPNQNMQSGWTGKSLEGSAVKEPDQLDMSEEAKAERWFKRVAQIKDISELSQIPDEDFPSIMPMRKGVNRFVVSKRKTPMERRLTSPQYRRNLPVERYDPSRKDNNSSETK